MDPKAAAKSKRSHTVHGRRVHQTPAAAAAHRQKRAAAAAATSSGPRSRNLPSNWDRYDAEGEAEDPAAAEEWTGEVAPRSKGADFGFLLEQARAQPPGGRDLSAPCLPSQDLPFDFMQASTSMLEAKGEGILSWCADDNFILEDDLAPDFEVPFLSMDLNALANHLSKIKLSRRLFIEEDLFPEDMADASEDNEIAIELDTSVEIDAKGSSVGHNLNSEPRKGTSHHEYASNICSDDQMKTECRSQCYAQETTASPKISTHSVSSDSEEDKTYKQIMDTDPGMSHSKGLKFEVGAAEEELDMLLNSFSGTHLSSANLDEPFEHASTLHEISLSNEKVEPSLSSKPPLLAPLNDALDDLLSETSLDVQSEGFGTLSTTSQPTANSGQNIGFRYAKKIDVTPSIDDSVDDLLEDTSSCLNEPKQITTAQASNSTPLDSVPLHSDPLNASASDDFDSWFDSL
ncbi:protein ECERIFERUM 16-like [Miscanthus floridulus]|uniref:protein ECERIFERUM 16-like n=1 Tax=Miscanthus floridulus TaxID=154761 RepID=UPI00345B006A